jgi:glucose-1-phosphate thymidylyltransferase
MKGVILAGGLGERLKPLTAITNKHLLPVYNKPMILYPLETLKKSGLNEIMIVCGKMHAGHFMNFLGSGKDYGVKLSYALQDKDNGGIADALGYAEDFADEGSVAVILGDNIFEDDFSEAVGQFSSGAKVFLKEVKDPWRFGVPVFDPKGEKIIRIEEKPREPKSNYAQVGLYIFDNRVFEIIKNLKPSERGELEIVDVTNFYLSRNELSFDFVRGFWSDVGTHESLMETAMWLYKKTINE